MNLKITNEHRAIISFQRHGVVVGALNLEAKPPTFTGDFDESAKIFIAAILKMMPRLVPVEEVEKAFVEGHLSAYHKPNSSSRDAAIECWEESRARRVVEGKDVE